MLAFALWALCRANLPVIILPPLYGSNLYVSYNKTDLPWYCPSEMDNELLWVDTKLFVPPRINCLLKLLQVFYDTKTGKIGNRPGVEVKVHPDHFGGDESVRYVDSGILGHQFVDALASMTSFFLTHGYRMKKDLYAAPYDWRIAPAGIDEFWGQLHDLIIEAYLKNGNTKVTILGYSCGAFNLHHFLTTKVTEEWKQKYIEKIVFLAPSFTGTHDVFDGLFNRYTPLIPFWRTEVMADMVESLPCVHAHLQNVEVFGNLTMVVGPDGENYTAADLKDLLIRHNRVRGDCQPMLEKSMPFRQKAPVDINLPTMVIYNTGVPTHVRLEYNRGWDKWPDYVTDRGDGTIPANGAEWVCEKWDHTRNPMVCVDLDNDHQRFNHQPLTYNPYVHELLFNVTTRNDWIEKKSGKTVIKLPLVDILKNETYRVRDDLRPINVTEFE